MSQHCPLLSTSGRNPSCHSYPILFYDPLDLCGRLLFYHYCDQSYELLTLPRFLLRILAHLSEVAFCAHPCISSRQLHFYCLMGCQKHNKATTVQCIETLREKSIIKACLTSMCMLMYNSPGQQNALDEQEILY